MRPVLPMKGIDVSFQLVSTIELIGASAEPTLEVRGQVFAEVQVTREHFTAVIDIAFRIQTLLIA